VPTILTKDGKLAMVIGTPGGSRIITSVFQVLANVYDFDMPLQPAVNALRFHHQLLPENTIYAEPFAKFSDSLKAELKLKGYVTEDQGWNGDIEAIQIKGSTPVPAADPRGRGVAMVVR
jgi:gamma-glutamyltranspeptidase/glutathione hydrolase